MANIVVSSRTGLSDTTTNLSSQFPHHLSVMSDIMPTASGADIREVFAWNVILLLSNPEITQRSDADTASTSPSKVFTYIDSVSAVRSCSSGGHGFSIGLGSCRKRAGPGD